MNYTIGIALRLWSLHPKYLDSRGLVALWREALLAQAVLKGETSGYRHHPQLSRFRARQSPLNAIAEYLRAVYAESEVRGYQFDRSRISRKRDLATATVTRGQLQFEWGHLMKKVTGRDKAWAIRLGSVVRPRAHPLFRIVPGDIEEWERIPDVERK